jgi:hypothetical protein
MKMVWNPKSVARFALLVFSALVMLLLVLFVALECVVNPGKTVGNWERKGPKYVQYLEHSGNVFGGHPSLEYPSGPDPKQLADAIKQVEAEGR